MVHRMNNNVLVLTYTAKQYDRNRKYIHGLLAAGVTLRIVLVK